LRVRFAKYHGLGNDFVVVDLRAVDSASAAAIQQPATVKAVCDRQFGVGADGVLAILDAPGADARMRVLNADGSEAEMCGNGIRCVVEELHARGGIAKDQMAIETGAGRLVCERKDGGVTVGMGAPRLARGEIPMTGPATERCVNQAIEIIGHPTRHITCVSMGNPHAVIFIDSDVDLRDLAETIGPRIEHHAWFPARTNVEIVRARDRRELDVVVWERGVGITLACGTGACASVVAAILTGRADEDTDVRVNLLGGSLAIRVLPGMSNVRMHGPAAHVFDGELDPTVIAPRP
jgi:diaminopimelate epimerase